MLRFIGRRSAQYQRTGILSFSFPCCLYLSCPCFVCVELVVGNIIRRVLRIIRDEYKSIPEEGTTDVESEGGDYDEQDISNGISVLLSLWTLTVMLACLLAARMDAEQDEA